MENIQKMTFITFDGPTATGKSTLIKRLEEHYLSLGDDVFVVDERNEVRNLMEVFHNKDLIRSELPPITESCLWVANQLFRIELQIIPYKNRLVMADRYIYTPIVYQYLALMNEGAKLEDVIKYISMPFGIPIPIPDISIIVTASIDVIEERFYIREKRKMKESERNTTIEAIKLYAGLADYFNNYFLVDSSKDREEVFDSVRKIILKNK